MTTASDKAVADLSLRAPRDAADWQAIHGLRRRALFDNDVIYDESHADDRNPDHRVFVLIADGALIGTLRIDFTHPVWAAVRLVAVAPARRGLGFGAAMMGMAEAFIRDKGWRQVRLHAKSDAVGFYRRCGYREVHWEEPPQDPNGVNMGKDL